MSSRFRKPQRGVWQILSETRAIRNIQDVLDQILEPQYLAAEALIRFSKNGLNIEEVPIYLKDRKTGKSYKGFLRYGLGILRAVIRTLLDKNLRKGTNMI